jgi:uncharacterized membrane protein
MIRPLILAALTGARAISPFAAVSAAAFRGELPEDNGAPPLIGHPVVAAGSLALAAAEMVGDKWSKSPDRIVLSGMTARTITGAVAAMSLAPKRQRVAAGLLGAGVAAVAAHLTFRARMAALRRYGQAPTGFVEDALLLAGTAALVRGAKPA